jgi:hypothetical protein
MEYPRMTEWDIQMSPVSLSGKGIECARKNPAVRTGGNLKRFVCGTGIEHNHITAS